jgi:ATP-dependent RNA helicase MSS116, mitochondrial
MLYSQKIFLLVSLFMKHSVYSFAPPSLKSTRNHVTSSAITLSSSDDIYSEGDSPDSKKRKPIRRPHATFDRLQQLEVIRKEAQKRHELALQDPTLLSKQSFSDRPDISPATKRAITEVLGLQRMTEIQARTYAAAFGGRSVLGRARTGTGKTIAALLPAVERLLAADGNMFKPGLSIGIIVISPTRELAIQIAEQAEALLTYHIDMDVACVYGGTKVQRDIRLLSGPRLPAILVATPGRMLELLDLRIGRKKFSDLAQETRVVVLDEADRLLHGFSRETQKILSFLPRAEKRQTLLFSATISEKLRGFIKGSMNIDFEEVDCLTVGDRKGRGEANVRVNQYYRILNSVSDYIPTLLAIIKRAMEEDENYKILVFFPASKMVRFSVQFLNVGLGMLVLEIHSRMSQASRTRASNAFRSSKNAILFSSDVSARGVDYPDVSLVVQFGAPSTEETYIHRLGRTGRAGRSGQGLVVLLPFERNRMEILKRGLEIEEDDDLPNLGKDSLETISSVREQVRCGHAVLTPSAESASRAFLAYYIANAGNLEPAHMLQYAKDFASGTGLADIPAMDAKIITKLGLEGLIKTEK